MKCIKIQGSKNCYNLVRVFLQSCMVMLVFSTEIPVLSLKGLESVSLHIFYHRTHIKKWVGASQTHGSNSWLNNVESAYISVLLTLALKSVPSFLSE